VPAELQGIGRRVTTCPMQLPERPPPHGVVSNAPFTSKNSGGFVPAGPDGDAIVDSLRSLTAEGGGHVLLNERISQAFDSISERLASSGAPVAARGQAEGDGFVVPPTLLATQASDLSAELTEECFGPLIVVARYDGEKDLAAALELMPHSLTATVHAEDDEADTVASLSRLLEPLVGRLVFNGYPTGVRVSWAQHHGGPWPSTNSQHTSVGVTAIRRFLRPFVWQNAPESVLPEELREAYSAIPRRIDGTLGLPGSAR